DGARDAVRFAGKLPNPVFELRTENWNGSPRALAPDVDTFAVLTQPVELGGKRGLRRQLAESDSDVASRALASLERELVLDTVRAYVHALKARALVDTLTTNRDALSALVASMVLRVEEGYSAEADLLKFKTEAARVEADIARARLELERSLAALTIATGATSFVRESQLVEPAALPVPAPDAAAIAASVARHPDVLEAMANVDRARRLTAYERARQLPDALVTGGYKRTAGFDTLVLGVSLAVPIFERNGATVARSLGIEQGAMAAREAVVQRLTSDTAALIHAARTIADQASHASRDLLEPAEVVRRAALAAFHEGTADVLKLIDAERVYADVHRAAIDLRLDAVLMTLEARFALGEETIP
ncbi:MAG TPA: TolC family protein, partial [Vicinamibacterales bacterium]|nr:TolC family protein [Vicinamibacterales bacterium]